MSIIPFDIYRLILLETDPITLPACKRVSKTFNRILSDEKFWQQKGFPNETGYYHGYVEQLCQERARLEDEYVGILRDLEKRKLDAKRIAKQIDARQRGIRRLPISVYSPECSVTTIIKDYKLQEYDCIWSHYSGNYLIARINGELTDVRIMDTLPIVLVSMIDHFKIKTPDDVNFLYDQILFISYYDASGVRQQLR